ALATIGLKTIAYMLTGSVGLLSDAAESVVNLIGAIMALCMLQIASRPADKEHPFGHSKAEYFSSITEGVLILVAAGAIGITAVNRLISPRPLEIPFIGLAVSVIASVINLVVAQILARAGQRHNSITLEADARHLMTDVWTSAGVIAGVFIVGLSGYHILDPAIAILVSANILRMGFNLVRRSVDGLMDTSLEAKDMTLLDEVLEKYRGHGIEFHALKTRQSAGRCYISVHVLVPGDWSVHKAHHLVEKIEIDVRKALPCANIITHLEPIEDIISYPDSVTEH
ncbi:MAG: cation transporter, partial [Sedimentisphaerales bacterium]|nr:cation transporter [Sedimentisphaerales bacterium]